MYAVVKAGGSQHKVAVGDTFTIDRLAGAAGDKVALPAILLVDGETVTSDAAALAKVTSPLRSSSTPRARRSTSTSTRTRPATRSVRVTVSS